jgi:S-adenosylmethionine hydrolase
MKGAAPIVTLTTDFGCKDPFVGIMKGVILSINPQVRLVDLTHDIERFNVEEAFYSLSYSYQFFPRGTIHLVVVDPGVGTGRRPLLAETGESFFLAPDNGALSFLFDQDEEFTVRTIESEKYLRLPVSQTFHGRDVFASVAAWLSRGIKPEKIGPVITDYKELNIPQLLISEHGVLGEVVHVDGFGNLITNIQRRHLEALSRKGKEFIAEIKGSQIRGIFNAYAENNTDAPGMIINSFELLEIFVYRGNAQNKTGILRGERVHVYVDTEASDR